MREPDTCKDVRDAKRRVSVEEIVRKQRVPTGGGKMERVMGTRSAESRREHANLGAQRERDVTEPSHSFQNWVLEERTVP